MGVLMTLPSSLFVYSTLGGSAAALALKGVKGTDAGEASWRGPVAGPSNCAVKCGIEFVVGLGKELSLLNVDDSSLGKVTTGGTSTSGGSTVFAPWSSLLLLLLLPMAGSVSVTLDGKALEEVTAG